VDLYLEACRLANIPAEVWGDGPTMPQLKSAWPAGNFVGWAQPGALRARLERAVALVVPSLWYETYGMVVAEAAAAGVAVIVSDNGAPATLVENGLTGLYFRVGDVADLAEKMALLNSDRQLAYDLGAAAYKRFWQDYDRRRVSRIKQIEDCYRMALESVA
jgi:glycosyltransferase involved in cell wall biosynthesis